MNPLRAMNGCKNNFLLRRNFLNSAPWRTVEAMGAVNHSALLSPAISQLQSLLFNRDLSLITTHHFILYNIGFPVYLSGEASV